MKKIFFSIVFFIYAFLWITLFLLEIFYSNFTFLITFLDNKLRFPLLYVLQNGNIRAFIDTVPIMLTPLLLVFLFVRIKRKWIRNLLFSLLACIIASIFTIDVILITYKIVTKLDFDFRLFWYNTSVFTITLWKIAPITVLGIIGGFLILIIFWYTFLTVISHKSPSKKTLITLLTLFIISFITQVVTFRNQREALIHFVYSIARYKHSVGTYYEKQYNEHIQKLLQQNNIVSGQVTPNALGKNIFIVELESVSNLVINEKITPQLITSAREGILFPHFYSTAVQTLRAQESILCGLPPTMHKEIIRTLPLETIQRLPCLPKMLQQLGYEILFFDSFYGDGGFQETYEFLKSIGFQEIHGYDIMQENDPKTSWGYREDGFYTRVFEYLEKHPTNEPRFVYITASATNHFPFEIDKKSFDNHLPYPDAQTIEQRAANATFVQDAYLGVFLEKFKQTYADQSSLLILSDTSWPVPIHGNIYNLVGAYEENFLIPLVFIPAKSISESFETGKVVQERFEQTDIVPTLLHLIHGEEPRGFLGQSFVPALRKNMAYTPSWKLSLQPYDGGYISLVRFPDKYLFNLTENTVTHYQLDSDPQERSPVSVEKSEKFLSLIDDYFQKNASQSTQSAQE